MTMTRSAMFNLFFLYLFTFLSDEKCAQFLETDINFGHIAITINSPYYVHPSSTQYTVLDCTIGVWDMESPVAAES